jgi:predicted nucleic acid-binding protein
MIFVDSSVWIDYFKGVDTRQALLLDDLAETGELIIGDLVLTEVLQGFTKDQEMHSAKAKLLLFDQVIVGDLNIAVQAADHYRTLRRMGITIRKTIDTLIATRCIVDGHHLLYSDKDFDPFVAHLGLMSAIAPAH